MQRMVPERTMRTRQRSGHDPVDELAIITRLYRTTQLPHRVPNLQSFRLDDLVAFLWFGQLCYLRRSLRFDFPAHLINRGQHVPFHVLKEFLSVNVTTTARNGHPAGINPLDSVPSVACASTATVGVRGVPLGLWLLTQSSRAEQSETVAHLRLDDVDGLALLLRCWVAVP